MLSLYRQSRKTHIFNSKNIYYEPSTLNPQPSTRNPQLAAIAFQCPFEGGHAVYRARALYLLNERAAFNDVQLCQNSEDRPPSLPGAALSAEPAEDFLLFPNPTQGGWNLGVPESHVGQPLSIRIHDISGQLLGRREIRAAASIERIDSRLESGIYFIEAWHEGRRIFSGRLVVIQ